MKCNLALCLSGTLDVFIPRKLFEDYHLEGKKAAYIFCGLRESLMTEYQGKYLNCH